MATSCQQISSTSCKERLTLCFSISELVGQRLALALGQTLNKSQCLTTVSWWIGEYAGGSSYVFAANGLDNIIRRSTQKFCDDGKLVDVVLSREERLALEHFREDATCTPDINLNIVFLPCEHNLRCAVVAGGNVSGHLRVLYTGQAEITDLQIAVFVYEDVAGLQVTVNNPSGVDVFQTTLSKVSLASRVLCTLHIPGSGKGNIG